MTEGGSWPRSADVGRLSGCARAVRIATQRGLVKVRATAAPAAAARTLSATLAVRYDDARPCSPLPTRATTSTLNVENVVNPPQNPVPNSSRPACSGGRAPSSAPRRHDPATLTPRVPQGKEPETPSVHMPTRYRNTHPAAPPAATSATAPQLTFRIAGTLATRGERGKCALPSESANVWALRVTSRLRPGGRPVIL